MTTTNGNNTTKHLACGLKNPSPASPPFLCPANIERGRVEGVAAFPCPDHSAVAKAHHKNVNEVDRQRAKTHHSKGTATTQGTAQCAGETHRDPPEPKPGSTSALGKKKKATNRKKYLLKIK